MSGSLNQVQLIGNLARDPEIRTFDNGGKVCNLRVITTETWNDKNTGERQERLEGHSVAIHNERIIQTAEKYLKKGSKVFIQGQMRTRKWQDKDGNDRYTTEVEVPRYTGVMTMLGGNNSGSEGGDSYYDSNEGSGSSGGRGGNSNRGNPSSYNRNNDRNDDRGNNRGGSRGNDYDDLDDDVPF